MRLEPERLEIIALEPEQLGLLAASPTDFERAWGCSYQAEAIEGDFQRVLLEQAAKAEADRVHFIWHTFWLMLRRADLAVVGTIDFKAVPDERGRVEIGYGLGERHRGRGYMTETVRALCAWAQRQDGVEAILAETEAGNLPSERVLRRCGFTACARGETTWWRLTPCPEGGS